MKDYYIHQNQLKKVNDDLNQLEKKLKINMK